MIYLFNQFMPGVQLPITSFLSNKELYVLDLTYNDTRWKKDINSNVIKQIKRPRLITFTTNINVIDLSNYGIYEEDKTKIALLKSNIQKAVRRNLPEIAIASAVEITKYKTGVSELLRRLCIIIVEDKWDCYMQIAKHYNTLIWMVGTEKGKFNWLEWVLGIIRFICDKKFRLVEHKSDINLKWSKNEYSCSLILRSFYGGMNGDMKLLRHCAKQIEDIKPERFDNEAIDINEEKDYDYDLLIIPAAADFHCIPSMLETINHKYPRFSCDIIKKSIWDGSSSIRFECEKTENEVWNIIKKDVYKFQKNYINKINF